MRLKERSSILHRTINLLPKSIAGQAKRQSLFQHFIKSPSKSFPVCVKQKKIFILCETKGYQYIIAARDFSWYRNGIKSLRKMSMYNASHKFTVTKSQDFGGYLIHMLPLFSHRDLISHRIFISHRILRPDQEIGQKFYVNYYKNEIIDS